MDLNKWFGIGKVQGAPQVVDRGGKKQASFTFTVNRRTQQANGQWVDTPMPVPVYAFDAKADLVEKYVVDGQELTLECYYQSWDAGNGQLGHGMIIQNVSFGFKPKRDVADAGAGPARGPMGPPGM